VKAKPIKMEIDTVKSEESKETESPLPPMM